jgi:hypothetical protein
MAVLAISLQVGMTTIHLAAQAATAAGPLLDLDKLGILYLCHPSGEALPSDIDRAPGDRSSPCVICLGFAAAGHAIAPAQPIDLGPSDWVHHAAPIASAIVLHVDSRPLRRYGVTRGPPSASLT